MCAQASSKKRSTSHHPALSATAMKDRGKNPPPVVIDLTKSPPLPSLREPQASAWDADRGAYGVSVDVGNQTQLPDWQYHCRYRYTLDEQYLMPALYHPTGPVNHPTGPVNYLASPPNHSTGPANPRTGPANPRGPVNHSTGPANHRTGPVNYLASPPNHSTGPANYLTGPANPRGPANHSTGPANHSTGPANHPTGPPNHSTGPPNHRTGPPNPRDPANHRTGSANHLTGPANYLTGPVNPRGPVNHSTGPANPRGPANHRTGPANPRGPSRYPPGFDPAGPQQIHGSPNVSPMGPFGGLSTMCQQVQRAPGQPGHWFNRDGRAEQWLIWERERRDKLRRLEAQWIARQEEQIWSAYERGRLGRLARQQEKIRFAYLQEQRRLAQQHLQESARQQRLKRWREDEERQLQWGKDNTTDAAAILAAMQEEFEHLDSEPEDYPKKKLKHKHPIFTVDE